MLSVTVPARVGAAAAVVLALLTGCGEDDDEDLSPFCQEVDDINEAFEGSEDLAGFGEALGGMDASPPDEIEDYWALVLDNWDEMVRLEAPEDTPDAAEGEIGEDQAETGGAGEGEADEEATAEDEGGEDEAADESAGEDEAAAGVALDPDFDVAARVVTSYLRDVCSLPIPER